MPPPVPTPVPTPAPTPVRPVRLDADAVHALLASHGPRLYGLCRALDPDPDDAYQEIWEKALRALPRFDPAGSAKPSTWLYPIAHHHLIDRQRRRKVRSVVGSLDAGPEPAAVGEAVDEGVARTRELARLQEALQALPDAQRRAVVFHYLDETPLPDLAEREGVPVGTLKSRLHLARARLLALLGGRR